MHNGDGKALPSCLYQIKYLNESLPFLAPFLYYEKKKFKKILF